MSAEILSEEPSTNVGPSVANYVGEARDEVSGPVLNETSRGGKSSGSTLTETLEGEASGPVLTETLRGGS